MQTSPRCFLLLTFTPDSKERAGGLFLITEKYIRGGNAQKRRKGDELKKEIYLGKREKKIVIIDTFKVKIK